MFETQNFVWKICVCVCARVCVCVYARARARVCVCVCKPYKMVLNIMSSDGLILFCLFVFMTG